MKGSMYYSGLEIYFTAKAYHDSGLNIIPLASKSKPRIAFAKWYRQRIPWYVIAHQFSSRGRPSGIAILGGRPSGNLEVIDFDVDCPSIYPTWVLTVGQQFPDLLTA